MLLRFPGIATLRLITAALCCAVGLFNGCKKEDVEVIVQTVPKQPQPQMQPSTMASMADQMTAATPSKDASGAQATWKLPEGWKELPGGGGMRFATIQVDTSQPELTLSVIPLEGDSGGMLANVNRWRGQIKLPTIEQADTASGVQQFDLNGAKVYWVNLLGPETANPREALLAAAVPNEGRTWFFKLQGPPERVAAQKDKFETFIRTVTFSAASQVKIESVANTAIEPLRYEVPAGWVKDEPQAMRTVSFHIGEGSEKVDIIVSQLPVGSSGGELDNINRWRGQVKLPPITSQAEMPLSQPIKVGNADGVVFDFIGPAGSEPAKRQIVARVAQGNNFWFFKIIGNEPQVRQQQANFDRFLKSVQIIAASVPAAKP